MSYNPNEIVRCRHIVALAEHLGDKLELILNGAVAAEDTRATPTLTLSPSSITLAQFKADTEVESTYTYNGDGTLYLYCQNADDTVFNFIKWKFMSTGTRVYATTIDGKVDNAQPCTIHLCATGTANYKPAEATLTITA